MSAILITTDLMATSAADGAARSASVELQTVSPGTAIASSNMQTKLAAIDLTSPISDLAGFVADLRAAAPNVTLLAYGPHVHEARLQAAREAGVEHVISRGQFHSQFANYLTRYATDGD